MRRHPRWSPAALVVGVAAPVCAVLWVATLVQGPCEFTLFLPLAVSLVVVGSLLGLRMPGNVISWLILAWGVDVSFCTFDSAWGTHAVRHHEQIGAVHRWIALMVPVFWHPGFVLFMLALLLFPHGHLVSRRWRIALVIVPGFCTALAVSAALSPRAELSDYIPGVPAPYTSPVEKPAGIAFGILLTCMLPTVLIAVSSLVVRWRRSTGEERRQVTAFAVPTAVALTVFVLSILLIGDGRLGVVLLAVLPISLAVAITRYRLYELDRVISRTLSYSIVTGVVVGVYVGAIQLIDLALPGSNTIAVAAATVTAAAVFTPVRRRVQRWVDRRFNRVRYDRERLVEVLRARLRSDVGLGQVETDLLSSVHEALAPTTASVWVRTT